MDNAGGNIFFPGELKDRVMDCWTEEIPQPEGTKQKRHLQFFPVGARHREAIPPGLNRRGQNLACAVRLYLPPKEIASASQCSNGKRKQSPHGSGIPGLLRDPSGMNAVPEIEGGADGANDAGVTVESEALS